MERMMAKNNKQSQQENMPMEVLEAACRGDYQMLYNYLHHGESLYKVPPNIKHDGPILLAEALSGYSNEKSSFAAPYKQELATPEQRTERLLDIAWMLVDAGLDVRITRGELLRTLGEPAALMNDVRYDARKDCPELDIFLKEVVHEGRVARAQKQR
jgi:hypothetical protein